MKKVTYRVDEYGTVWNGEIGDKNATVVGDLIYDETGMVEAATLVLFVPDEVAEATKKQGT